MNNRADAVLDQPVSDTEIKFLKKLGSHRMWKKSSDSGGVGGKRGARIGAKDNEKAKTHYDTFELSENSTSDQIKHQYKVLSLKYHPDKNVNKLWATLKFEVI